MSIVSINLGENQFNISCSDDAKHRLQQVANKLSSQLHKTREKNPNAAFDLLLVMTALKLQNALDNLRESKEQQLIETAHPNLYTNLEDIEKKLAAMVDDV